MEIKHYSLPGLIKINAAIVGFFEKIDIRILVFIVLCVNFLSFTLTQNEEAQLSLAKQFMDPAWMPHSFLFNEWPGNRLLFQLISGFFLRHIDFEPLVFFGRMAVFLFISLAVGPIFKKLEFANIYLILIFQIFLIHQSYFGGESIFGGFETKSLAYIFVMAGLYFLLNGNYLKATLFAMTASYFHILVGGWFFFVLFIYSIITTRSINLILKELLIFILILLPFIVYLGTEIFRSGTVINGVNIDWVYAYYRNAHHTAPLSVKGELPRTIFQIGITGLLFLMTLFVFRKFKGELLNKLFTLNIIIFSMLFISLGISLVDKTGFLLKFYLFRIATIGFFLMYIYVSGILLRIAKIPEIIKSLFLAIGFYIVVTAAAYSLQQILKPELKPEYHELVNFVKQNTSRDDVILSLGDYDISFPRMTRREEFVVYKFVPFGGKKIYEWYIRILERIDVANDFSKIPALREKYRLDYLLCDHDIPEGKILKLVYHNKAFSLYKIL